MTLWKEYKPWPSRGVIFKKLNLRTFDNRKQKSANCSSTWHEVTVLLQKQSCPFSHKCTAGRDVGHRSPVHTSYIQGCVQLTWAWLWNRLSFIVLHFEAHTSQLCVEELTKLLLLLFLLAVCIPCYLYKKYIVCLLSPSFFFSVWYS